jgi:hypothetical protein
MLPLIGRLCPDELYGARPARVPPAPVLEVDRECFRAAGGSSTPSPTLMIGFCSLRRDNPSSSSGLCTVWRTAVCAAQRVIHRCSACGEPGYKPPLASTVSDAAPVVHRCPPAIHRISTGFVPWPGDNAGTLPTRRPQNLQQAIHTPPQAVDENVTLSACPHRFPQGLSTSVRNGRVGCPPLGTNPWGRAVDNVGTVAGEKMRHVRGLAAAVALPRGAVGRGGAQSAMRRPAALRPAGMDHRSGLHAHSLRPRQPDPVRRLQPSIRDLGVVVGESFFTSLPDAPQLQDREADRLLNSEIVALGTARGGPEAGLRP